MASRVATQCASKVLYPYTFTVLVRLKFSVLGYSYCALCTMRPIFLALNVTHLMYIGILLYMLRRGGIIFYLCTDPYAALRP